MGWRQFKIPRKARAALYGLALLVPAVPPATAQVVLNELLAENGLWNQDDEGDYAVRLSERLFLGKGSVGCEDAADANDSGSLDISDAIFSLSCLFQGGSEPPPPYPTCGSDPSSGDRLTCDLPPSCGR